MKTPLVLIVEDQEGIRELLKVILQGNYEVVEADCAAALQRIPDECDPDVLLLDVRLPDANGMDLLPSLKQRWPAVEIIVLTGVLEEGTATFSKVEAIKRGAFDVFRKSADFNMEELLTGIGRALEHRNQRRDLGATRTE